MSHTAPDELNLSVQNEVLFDFNSTALRSSSRQAPRDMSGVLGRYPDTTIKVEGFTHSIGSAPYSERLSERRADSVASYLENLHVHSGRIRTIGMVNRILARRMPRRRAARETAASRSTSKRTTHDL